MKNKAEEKAKSLLKYIQKYPSQRFWQALLNWSGFPYIFTSQKPIGYKGQKLEDTFYIED